MTKSYGCSEESLQSSRADSWRSKRARAVKVSVIADARPAKSKQRPNFGRRKAQPPDPPDECQDAQVGRVIDTTTANYQRVQLSLRC